MQIFKVRVSDCDFSIKNSEIQNLKLRAECDWYQNGQRIQISSNPIQPFPFQRLEKIKGFKPV